MQIQKLICEMALEVVKSKEGCGVGFLDMDCVLNTQMFARDGVHLNQEGERSVGRRILTWIKEKVKMPTPSRN